MAKKWGKLHRSIGIRLAPQTYAALEALAKGEDRTVSAYIRAALEEAARLPRAAEQTRTKDAV